MRVLGPPPSTWSRQAPVEKEMGHQKLSFTLHSEAPEPSWLGLGAPPGSTDFTDEGLL